MHVKYLQRAIIYGYVLYMLKTYTHIVTFLYYKNNLEQSLKKY